MFVLNRDAVRELRRQLAPVVALLSDNKERVVRLVSYMRRGQAMIGGGGGGTSSSLVKNETIQSAAAATSVTTSSNNNVDDESSSMQLSAIDCGEWLLGRVLSALLLLLLADKKNENNNNDDDDANDVDDGEKKATNEVRSLLLAAGVDEATVEQTVKELNWKVRAHRALVFVVFAILFVANTRKRTTRAFMFLICCFVLPLLHMRVCIDNSFKVVRVTQHQQRQRRRDRKSVV